MKKLKLGIAVLLLSVTVQLVNAQVKAEQDTETIFATMDAQDAQKLSKLFPTEVIILESKGDQSAVKLTEKGAEEVHHTVKVHGPGYYYAATEAEALKAIQAAAQRKAAKSTARAATYTISQGDLVAEALDLVNNFNIANQIVELESYGTRYHTTNAARQSVVDLQAKWQGLASGRSDVSVRLVEHSSSPMPSVVMTIEGTEEPDEFVIMGGHIDSTASGNNTTNAPGADDNASGIATITEVANVLMAMDFRPKRTVEFMAYAAEEVGLRGSREIAQDYKSRNVNVISYLQFDMTNYEGSQRDVFIYDDSYTDDSLNDFLKTLMDTYNASGTHAFTYSTSVCNYGCSDHFSWSEQGYDVTFPSEASFSQSSPFIHTTNDTSSRFPTPNATHAAKFAKLGLEYIIEVGNGVQNDDGGGDGDGDPDDICDGVAPYDRFTSYSNGDQVTYQELLYERQNNSWVVIGECGTPSTPDPVDICDGVAPYNSSTTYVPGDRVTYAGSLYERTTTGWTNLGACGTRAAKRSDNVLNMLTEADSAEISVYPNPVVNGKVTISVQGTLWEASTLLVVTINGEILNEQRITASETELDLNGYASGMYFVTLVNGQDIYNKKMMIK